MRIIAFAIVVPALANGLGKNWPSHVNKDVLSKPVRDPMIEATMMQVGYTHAGSISDSVMLHAAQMVVHQLLDPTSEEIWEPDRSDAHPLPDAILNEVKALVLEQIEASISVEDLARHVGISRYHFSRASGRRPANPRISSFLI